MKLRNKVISYVTLSIFIINAALIALDGYLVLGSIHMNNSETGAIDYDSFLESRNEKILKDTGLTLNAEKEENSGENEKYRQSGSRTPTNGWADSSYLYRKNITLDPSAGSTGLTNFPVLIDLYDSDLQQYTRADGWDIIFTDDQGNKLDFEIELYDRMYNSTKAHLVAWVKTDLSPIVGTIISMYFGRTVTANQENVESIWTNYEAVWHLSESEGSGNYIVDSTDNGYDGTPSGTQFVETGKSAGARNFTGSDNTIIMDNGGNLLNGWASFSFSFWIYPDFPTDAIWESESEGGVFYKQDSTRMARLYRQSWHDPGEGNFQSDMSFITFGTSYAAVTINRQQWNHITYTYDG
ncbi:MAG: hypothetical protein ACFFCQ_17900, partial [Promethearchaeota archaeon]